MSGNIEVLYSGMREGKFLLFCITEVENGQYIVFTLEPHSLLEPYAEPNRETAMETVKKFFYDTD